MDIDKLQEFLLWSLLISTGLYLVSVVAVVSMREFMCNLHAKLFGLDKESVSKALYQYLALFKLLLIVFNFVPWVAITIIN